MTNCDRSGQGLLVDDDPDILDLSSTSLEREQDALTVGVEGSGSAALSTLETQAVDCVVSDYEMPAMDGLELLREIRETHPDLSFILFTGKGSESIAAEAISASVTDCVQKRAACDRYTMLANRIRNAVDRNSAREAAQRNLRFLETVLDRANDVVAVLDPDETVRFVSGAVEEVLGYTPAEVREQGPLAAVHPDDRGSLEARFAERLSNPDAPTGIEFRTVGPGGSVVPVEARAYNLLDDPDVEGIIVYVRTVEPTP